MIEGKWFAQNSDISLPLRLRETVFARGRDALDAGAQQAVVYREGTPVGTGRLWWQDGEFFAGDIGVLAQERGKGYGDLLVRLLLYKATAHGAKSLALFCPETLSAFFARYGFAAVQRPMADGNLTQGEDCACAVAPVSCGKPDAPVQTLLMRADLREACLSCEGCGGCARHGG